MNSTEQKVTIGIDPGLSGAIAVRTTGTHAAALAVFDIPTTTRWITGRGHVREIDPLALRRLVGALPQWDQAVIERVHAMPGQGVTSMFSFGRSLGVLEMAFTTNAGTVQYVLPQRWKRHYGLLHAPKAASRKVAQELYPALADLFKRVKDDGRAEATLIAHFAATEGLDNK